jgi:ribonuclease P protein component
VREAFRLSKAELPTGVDFVVVPKGPGLTFEKARTAFPALARAAARRLGPIGPPGGAP